MIVPTSKFFLGHSLDLNEKTRIYLRQQTMNKTFFHMNNMMCGTTCCMCM